MQGVRCGPCLGGQRPPVQLLKAESAGIVIVDFQYRRLQESPGVLCRAARSIVRAVRRYRRLPIAASRTRMGIHADDGMGRNDAASTPAGTHLPIVGPPSEDV